MLNHWMIWIRKIAVVISTSDTILSLYVFNFSILSFDISELINFGIYHFENINYVIAIP